MRMRRNDFYAMVGYLTPIIPTAGLVYYLDKNTDLNKALLVLFGLAAVAGGVMLGNLGDRLARRIEYRRHLGDHYREHEREENNI